jgi:hypothetical protein
MRARHARSSLSVGRLQLSARHHNPPTFANARILMNAMAAEARASAKSLTAVIPNPFRGEGSAFPFALPGAPCAVLALGVLDSAFAFVRATGQSLCGCESIDAPARVTPAKMRPTCLRVTGSGIFRVSSVPRRRTISTEPSQNLKSEISLPPPLPSPYRVPHAPYSRVGFLRFRRHVIRKMPARVVIRLRITDERPEEHVKGGREIGRAAQKFRWQSVGMKLRCVFRAAQVRLHCNEIVQE